MPDIPLNSPGGGVGDEAPSLPWLLLAPRGPWALAPASPWRPHLWVERRLAAGGGGEDAPRPGIRPRRLHVFPHRFWALFPLIEEPEGRREVGEARTWVLGVLTKANWGWAARLYRLSPPAAVLLLGPAFGMFIPLSPQWKGPSQKLLRQ